jgi:hypothetical protein
MKIAFLSNKLTLRGTEINLYNYAHYNETILNNESIIITRPYEYVKIHSPMDVHPQAYQKFHDRFPVEYYINPSDIHEIVKRNNIDLIFIEKAGASDDGLTFNYVKTIIHCVFTTKHPHGTLYTSISETLNKIEKTFVPVLPNIVDIHPSNENLRKDLNIPDDALIFGTYSGADCFNIDYIRRVVIDIGNNPNYSNIYFIFLNIDPFCQESEHIRFLPGTSNMEMKRKFINTCNAMLYGRDGGETFGLSCGEFSLCDKPIIARPGEHSWAHEDILRDCMIKQNNYHELHEILTNWNKYNKDVSNNGYKKYTPENVMNIFKYWLDRI